MLLRSLYRMVVFLGRTYGLSPVSLVSGGFLWDALLSVLGAAPEYKTQITPVSLPASSVTQCSARSANMTGFSIRKNLVATATVVACLAMLAPTTATALHECAVMPPALSGASEAICTRLVIESTHFCWLSPWYMGLVMPCTMNQFMAEVHCGVTPTMLDACAEDWLGTLLGRSALNEWAR